MPIERTVDKRALLAAIRRLDPGEFEKLIADLFRAHGRDVELTPGSYDNGRDVIVRHRFLPGQTIVQVKRYADDNLLRSPDIEQYSGLYSEPSYVRRVLVLTSGPVTGEAEKLATRRDVDLIDEEDLVNWLLEMDPQLTVVEQYIDPEAFIEEDWPSIPDLPPTHVLVLLAVGPLLMLATAGGSTVQPLTAPTGESLHTLSGLYFVAGLLTILGVYAALRHVSFDLYTRVTAAVLVLFAVHLCGLFGSGYWWYRRLRLPETTTTASESAALTTPDVLSSSLDPELVALLPNLGLGIHVTTAVLFSVGFLWARLAFRYRLRIDSA